MAELTVEEVTSKFWSHVQKTDTCWLWTRSLNHGYGQLWVNGKRWIAPRLAWVLTYGPLDSAKRMVCHHCDNPRCVRPDHLFLASQTDNLADMRRKGRGSPPPPPRRGCFNNKTSMSDDDVRTVRARYANGEGYRTIAKSYGVWHTTIADIVKHRTWSHIK
jgi:hypothetical protein